MHVELNATEQKLFLDKHYNALVIYSIYGGKCAVLIEHNSY